MRHRKRRLDGSRDRELAARSGLTPGTLRFLASGNAANALALADKDQLEKNLGVVVDLESYPLAEALSRQAAGDYDLSSFAWNADYPTPDNFLYPLSGRGSRENTGGYDDGEYNSLIVRGRAQKEPARRRRICQQAERLAIGRDVALIPAFDQPILDVVDSDEWTGVPIDFFGHLYFERHPR